MTSEIAPVEEHLHQLATYAVGDLLGQYRINHKIGDGGMGTVYRCTDLSMNRVVAVKVLHPHLVGNDKSFLRFRNEAEAIGKLEHPAIIKIHQFCADDPPFMVMDYVKGKSLADILAVEGSLSVERSMCIAQQIADALAHAHARAVVHRDLKPANIMILGGDAIQILDFGIAKFNDSDETNLIKLTQVGEVCGSPAYMSPEQVLGKKVGPESDQYSFGCLLYECLTGNPPFIGTSPVDVMMRHASDEEPLSLHEATLGKSFPPYVEQLLKKLLAKKPEDRFASMDQVYSALKTGKLPIFEVAAPAKTKNAKLFLAQTLPTLVVVALVSIAIFFLFHNVMDKVTVPSTPSSPTTSTLAIKAMSDEEKEKYDANQAFIVQLHNPTISPLYGWKSVRIFQRGITDEALAEVKKYPKIAQLQFDNSTNLTDEGLKNLVGLPLKGLCLNGVDNISDAGIATICQIKSLKVLQLRGTSITDEGLAMLKELPDLEDVNFCKTPKVTFSGVENFLSSHKKLKFFATDLDWDTPDSDLHRLVDQLSEEPLRWLRADGAEFHDADLQTLARIMTLQQLSLSRAVIKGEGFDAILKMKNLRKLRTPEFSGVTAEQVARLSQSNPKLIIDHNIK